MTVSLRLYPLPLILDAAGYLLFFFAGKAGSLERPSELVDFEC